MFISKILNIYYELNDLLPQCSKNSVEYTRISQALENLKPVVEVFLKTMLEKIQKGENYET